MTREEDLIKACANGDLPRVAALVEQGAHIDISGTKGPLITAVSNDHIDVVGYLLQKGANIDIRNENGSTPLCFAAFYGNYRMASLLLSAGADRHVMNAHGKSPADYAREGSKKGVLELLTSNPEQISFSHQIADRTMQEIFDFPRKERVTLIRKEDGGVEAVLRDSFASLDNKEGLTRAFNEHKRVGGKMSEEEVFGQAIAKARTKLPFNPQ